MKVIYNGKKEIYISLFKKSSIFLFIIVIVVFSVWSCTKSDTFSIGENFVESQTNLKILDTFKVDLSTVLLDSVVTSGTKAALVGQYSDNIFGSISSQSYFELGYPTSFNNIDFTYVYDSANFVLSYSKYYYGDTTKLMTISIQQLTQRITFDETTGYLYNTSKISYSPSILGTKVFYPRPKSADTVVTIPVNAFGKQIFNLIQTKNDIITTSETFLNYLEGFAITSETGNGKSINGTNSAILGFKADEKHIFFKIYYHTKDNYPVSNILSIPFSSNTNTNGSAYQFNNIQYDLSGCPLSKIKESKNILSSTTTGNKAYLQGILGLMPKIQFPSLQNLIFENRWKILKAELIIAPVKNSYSSFLLPSQLYLYDTDKRNQINSQLTVNGISSGKNIVSTLNVDELYNENTTYTFDITNFISTEASSAFFDYQHGILIGLSSSYLTSSFARLIVENKNPAVKLRLYYLTY
jgi:hypothetical protein